MEQRRYPTSGIQHGKHAHSDSDKQFAKPKDLDSVTLASD